VNRLKRRQAQLPLRVIRTDHKVQSTPQDATFRIGTERRQMVEQSHPILFDLGSPSQTFRAKKEVCCIGWEEASLWKMRQNFPFADKGAKLRRRLSLQPVTEREAKICLFDSLKFHEGDDTHSSDAEQNGVLSLRTFPRKKPTTVCVNLSDQGRHTQSIHSTDPPFSLFSLNERFNFNRTTS
jgi:hypothetical protein